ncbi:C40 family peptidase [Clostridium sp.]|uniref:C40 family peptidase n=1 Tax=Clostridium sp. TaxID=1506 RepID=UPI001A62853B|nr:C40 family peptidase [Clostridium sp.]MBK5234404.1 C40 family peptidase [Clostridium sp.]
MQKNYEKLEISIEMLDSDIEGIFAGIDKAKYEIIDTEKKIEKTVKDIVVAKNNIKGEESLFNERMRAMYMNGADSYLEILLDSNGIEDFISRVENVKSVVEYDNKIISELNEKKKNIDSRKKALNDNRIKVLALQTDNEDKLDKLSIKKKEQDKLIIQAEKDQELYKNEIAETQVSLGNATDQIKNADQIKNVSKQVKVASNQAPKYDVAVTTKRATEIIPSRGQVSNEVKNETRVVTNVEPNVEPIKEVSEPKQTSLVSSNEVIAFAETFMGTPYEWGATGPNTFDCSGFVQYVYAHFGVSTGRVTYDQITHGEFVPRENLQPGDLVFFGIGTPHHVGIYVGNGSYIHAPRTGDVVKISQLTRDDYLSSRRVR